MPMTLLPKYFTFIVQEAKTEENNESCSLQTLVLLYLIFTHLPKLSELSNKTRCVRRGPGVPVRISVFDDYLLSNCII